LKFPAAISAYRLLQQLMFFTTKKFTYPTSALSFYSKVECSPSRGDGLLLRFSGKRRNRLTDHTHGTGARKVIDPYRLETQMGSARTSDGTGKADTPIFDFGR